MWSRLRGVLVGVLAIGSGFVLSFGALATVTPVDSLVTANTLRAHAGPQVPRTVAVAVRPVAGYGLTPSERAKGLPPLNDDAEVDAPPPPAFFLLRFSDAPGEEYVVLGRGNRVRYFVRDVDGGDVPQELATWKLGLGRMRRDGDAARGKDWILEFEVERQSADVAAEGEEGLGYRAQRVGLLERA